MNESWLTRWLDRRFPRHEIGRGGLTLMTRWALFKREPNGLRLFLHRLNRTDPDPPHDHPWGFLSLIVWGGYWEIDANGRRRWYGPGRLLRRAAEWRHTIELPAGKTAWSLVLAGPKVRDWFFWCRAETPVPVLSGAQPAMLVRVDRKVHWKLFTFRINHGQPGCE